VTPIWKGAISTLTPAYCAAISALNALGLLPYGYSFLQKPQERPSSPNGQSDFQASRCRASVGGGAPAEPKLALGLYPSVNLLKPSWHCGESDPESEQVGEEGRAREVGPGSQAFRRLKP